MENSFLDQIADNPNAVFINKLNKTEYPDEFFHWFLVESMLNKRFTIKTFTFLINTLNWSTYKEFGENNGTNFIHQRFLAAVNNVKQNQNIPVQLDLTYGSSYSKSHNYAKYMFAKLFEHWKSITLK